MYPPPNKKSFMIIKILYKCYYQKTNKSLYLKIFINIMFYTVFNVIVLIQIQCTYIHIMYIYLFEQRCFKIELEYFVLTLNSGPKAL